MNRNDSGYTTIIALVLMFFLTALAGGLYIYIVNLNNRSLSYIENQESNTDSLSIVKDIINFFTERPFNDADGKSTLETVKTEFKVEVFDISSKLNPNYERKFLFEKTELHTLFLEDFNPQMLQDFRSENGLGSTLAYYKDVFKEEYLSKFFTMYSWCNINTADPFASQFIIETRTGDTGLGVSIFSQIQDFLRNKELFTQEKLEEILGTKKHFPYLTTEPQLNVNFMPELILRQILKYPAYEIDNADSICNEILRRRETSDVTAEDLTALLEKENDHPIYAYLGVKTWFYEILIPNDPNTALLDSSYLPNPEDSVPTGFSRIILGRKTIDDKNEYWIVRIEL